MLPWCCYPICAKVLSAAGTLSLQSAMRAPMCHTITVRHLQAQPQLLFSMHRSHWLKWDFYMFKGSRIGAAPANDPCLHSWGQKWKLLTFKQHHWDSLHHIFHPFLVLCSQLLSSSRRAQLFFTQGVTKLFFPFSLLQSGSWEFSSPKVSRIKPQLISFQEPSREEKLAFWQKNCMHRFFA